MPASRAVRTDSGTQERSGSMEAAKPSSRRPVLQAASFWSGETSSSFASKGSRSRVFAAMASTRSAFAAYASMTSWISLRLLSVSGAASPSSNSNSVQSSKITLGAPLQMTSNSASSGKGMPPVHSSRRPDTSVTVSIILRQEEKGISNTRLYSFPMLSWRPIFRAATTRGASDESPFGSHLSPPVAGSLILLRRVLQHKSAARSMERTDISLLASLPLSSRVTPPTVGSKPLPSTL
mmetsp:Transcript_58364/g.147995  ORF Transcript_58364/g.147995 Transcript_58364/m.147995 type:complete len:237 (+) Transcript_58364:1529-2239(+)